jgi:hypothetical protein
MARVAGNRRYERDPKKIARFDLRQECPHSEPELNARVRNYAIARSIPMMDVIMLAVGLGFFVLSVGYCYACDLL